MSDGDERIEVGTDQDVVRVRQLVRTVAVSVKLSLVDQTKLVTAASELARNTLVYGGGGTVEVDRVDNGRRQGIRIVFRDQGPGIADLDLEGVSPRGQHPPARLRPGPRRPWPLGSTPCHARH